MKKLVLIVAVMLGLSLSIGSCSSPKSSEGVTNDVVVDTVMVDSMAVDSVNLDTLMIGQ